MRKLFIAAIAAAGILGMSPAAADVFEDGLFETKEYSAYSDGFGIWDQNDDGWLTEDEFGNGWMEVGFSDSDRAFDEFDDDRNGMLAENEFFQDDEFGAWDRDDDGILGNDEWIF